MIASYRLRLASFAAPAVSVGLVCLALVSLSLGACSHVSTVRLQSDAVEVGPSVRPIAGIQANAISAYVLFIPIPGVDLDKVVNRMLIVTAKTIGADKVANLRFDIDPSGGIWALRKLFFYRSAQASGIAVQVIGHEADPNAHMGPEAPTSHPAPTSGVEEDKPKATDTTKAPGSPTPPQ